MKDTYIWDEIEGYYLSKINSTVKFNVEHILQKENKTSVN